jgi:hypothetical protein
LKYFIRVLFPLPGFPSMRRRRRSELSVEDHARYSSCAQSHLRELCAVLKSCRVGGQYRVWDRKVGRKVVEFSKWLIIYIYTNQSDTS